MRFTRWIFSSLLLSIFIVFGSSVYAATQMTLYINDAQSSPVVALDKFGNVLWTERYQSYGQPQDQSTASKSNPISYTAHEFDRDTQLIYMGGRYYDAKLGRFLSVDPVEFIEANVFSFNRYAYANNNPYAFHDPDGQFPLDYLVDGASIGISAGLYANDPSVGNALGLAGDVVLGVIPYVPSGIGIVRAVDKAGDVVKGAESTKQASDLSRHLGYAEKYGQAGVKELENGRIRYFGELQPANNAGEMAGRRYVHEFDSAKGNTRGWHETLDHSGTVRQVRPELNNGSKKHYKFDQNGNYTGSW